jgi:hypothetical protein
LVTVWDATTGERVGLYDATNRGEVFDLSFFQNGKYVLITGLPEEGK